MAVRTADFALRDFCIDGGHAAAPPSELGDGCALRADVVELEHDRVALAAIRACASSQDRVDVSDVSCHVLVNDRAHRLVCLCAPPAGPAGGSATMAVGADDLAARDLDVDRVLGRSVSYE